jgi:hypothetical protein
VRAAVETVVTVAVIVSACATTAGVGCVIAVSAYAGAAFGTVNFALDHRGESGRRYDQGLVRAGALGALKGAVVPAAIGRLTGGRATGLFGVGRRVFNFFVLRRDRW